MSSFELLLDAMMRKPSPARDWSSDAIFSSSHRALLSSNCMKFATDNLGPVCSPGNIDVCDAAQKKLIAKYQAMDADALTKLIDGKEKELADAETKFSEEVEKLQKTYEKLSKEKDETKERATQGRNHAPARWRRGGTHWFSSTGINDDDFKFAKAVKKAAAKASATDEL